MQIARQTERPATIKEWLDRVLPLWRPMIGIELDPKEKIITSCAGFMPGTRKPIDEKIIKR